MTTLELHPRLLSGVRLASTLTPAPPLIRQLMQSTLADALGGGSEEAPPARIDDGLFGPSSASWRLLSDIAALPAGLLALLVQTQHPIVMSAVAQNSVFREDPLGRLRRTAGFVGEVTCGDTATALRAVDIVRSVHARISGLHLGREWRSDDSDLVDWVHCSLVESLLACDRAYAARPLVGSERDQFVAEQALVAEMLGDLDPPRSARALRDRMDEFAPQLAVGDDAREALVFLRRPPLPAGMAAAYPVLWHAAVAAMHRGHRERLGLCRPPLARSASVGSLALLRACIGTAPIERSDEISDDYTGSGTMGVTV
ncbi:oxygenase MpaB family protein [soil metagenome]